MKKWVAFFGLTILFLVTAICLVQFAGPGVQPEQQVANEFPCGPKVYVFGAKWCGNCPKANELNQWQTKYPNVEIIDIDIDKYPELKAKYRITKVPFFVVCSPQGCWPTADRRELFGWLDETN